MTYPFRKQPVARTKSATVAQAHAPAWNASLVLHDHVLLIVPDEILEPLHQLGVVTKERARAMNEDRAVDEILAEEVTKLEKLIEGVLVADRLLRAIEEAKLIARRGR